MANAPVVGPGYTKIVRDQMWGPGATDLSPEQLSTHRRMNRLAGDADLKALGGYSHNLPKVGPATMGSQVYVDPNGGQYIRRMSDGIIGQGEVAHVTRNGGPFLSKAKPVDDTLYRAVVNHEGAEKALIRAATVDETLPGRMTATHFGGMPQIAEQLGSYRDPEAQKIFQKARQLNPDDAHIYDKMRQFGGRPDSPLPIGGKGHVALERDLAGYTPRTLPASSMRATHAMLDIGHGPNVKSKLLERAEQGLSAVGQRLQQAFPKYIKSTKPFEQAAQSLGKMLRSSAVDPVNMGEVLKRLPSLVRG